MMRVIMKMMRVITIKMCVITTMMSIKMIKIIVMIIRFINMISETILTINNIQYYYKWWNVMTKDYLYQDIQNKTVLHSWPKRLRLANKNGEKVWKNLYIPIPVHEPVKYTLVHYRTLKCSDRDSQVLSRLM